MLERDVFGAALLIPDEAARRAYLETVCAGDEALRRRLEILLHAHEGARQFLERSPFKPDDLGVTRVEATAALLSSGESVGSVRDDDDEENSLDFLGPSAQPGSLGRLAHYEVHEVLGRGGFGTVVRAFDEKLHRMVAIKVMARGLAATSPPRKRFLREARAAAAVRHEHVVSIHAVDEQPIPYLVMEYVAGPTLQAKLDRSGPMEVGEVLRIGYQIADGLAAAHRQGLIHRDIKPANILLEGAAERVKITDFGLARAADDASLTQSGTIAGTPMYMAPEQALGETIDQRADLFSLGSVLYVMCTGRPPFRASSTLAVLRRVAEDAPRPILEVISEVPVGLCNLIDRLHAKDPADRFSSAEEVADLLRAQFEAQRSPRNAPLAATPPRPGARAKPAPFDSEFFPSAKRAMGTDGQPQPTGPSLGTLLIWSFVAVLVLAGLFAWDQSRRRAEIALGPATPAPLAVVPPPVPEVATGRLSITVNDLDAEILVTAPGTSIVSPGGTWSHLIELPPGKYRYTARLAGRVVGGGETIILGNETKNVQLFVKAAPEVTTAPGDLGPWGRLVDPLGDVRARRDGDRLIVTLPADAPRDLNPTTDPLKNLNAPRFLRAVEGDFDARVTVFPAPKPSGPDGYAYHFAGLVVWSTERDFLRFGVAANGQADDGKPFLDLEFFRDLKDVEGDMHGDGEGPIHLLAERRGNTLYLKTSPDGREWSVYKACNLMGMPTKVFVGVTAINTTTTAFEPQFTGWALRSIGPAAPDAAAPVATTDPGAWGRFIDLKGGSRVVKDGDRGTILMPANAPRELNPDHGLTTEAPRLVTDVVGDFRFEVTALSFPTPNAAASVRGNGDVYHWFGPVIWADEGNFLRCGVGRSTGIENGFPGHNFASFRNRRTIFHEGAPTYTGAVHFRIERRGDTLFVKQSPDGQHWSPLRTCSLTGMPARLQVGVAAINSGLDTFSPEFVGWRLEPLPTPLPADPTGGPIPTSAFDLGPWGRLVTPVADCQATREGDHLTIALPANVPCDLSPAPDKDLAAPCLLQAVAGDFTTQVQVLPSPRPQRYPEAAPHDQTYHFAGLVVWADQGNLIRFGLNGSTDYEAGRPCLDLQCFRDRQDVTRDIRHTTEGPVYVQAERRGDKLILKSSPDGQAWTAYRTCTLTGLPAKLYVGVTAINAGAGSFAPEFANWSLRADSPPRP